MDLLPDQTITNGAMVQVLWVEKDFLNKWLKSNGEIQSWCCTCFLLDSYSLRSWPMQCAMGFFLGGGECWRNFLWLRRLKTSWNCLPIHFSRWVFQLQSPWVWWCNCHCAQTINTNRMQPLSLETKSRTQWHFAFSCGDEGAFKCFGQFPSMSTWMTPPIWQLVGSFFCINCLTITQTGLWKRVWIFCPDLDRAILSSTTGLLTSWSWIKVKTQVVFLKFNLLQTKVLKLQSRSALLFEYERIALIRSTPLLFWNSKQTKVRLSKDVPKIVTSTSVLWQICFHVFAFVCEASSVAAILFCTLHKVWQGEGYFVTLLSLSHMMR